LTLNFCSELDVNLYQIWAKSILGRVIDI